VNAKSAPARTYQNLITCSYDEECAEYFLKTELVLYSIHTGDSSTLNVGGSLVAGASISPDSKYVLVTLFEKPFSWSLPASKFPRRVEAWCFNSALRKNPAPSNHVKSLTKHPAYPERCPVTIVPFATQDESYSPIHFTHPVVQANPVWADEEDVDGLQDRFTHNGNVFVSANSKPINPVGRTGMTGRGLLGKWGPNHAADAIVTRDFEGQLQMVAIKRNDTGEWAIPGGMVDPGETAPVAMKREFMEEAGNLPVDEAVAHKKMVDDLFSGGRHVYSGYVDDPRNTDNAWMETVCYHFHCDAVLGEHLKLQAGDDASHVRWLTIDSNVNLYASHQQFVAMALSKEPLSEKRSVVDVRLVATIPSGEGEPLSFDATQTGPRDFTWHWRLPSTLLFRLALDEGDPKNKAEFRDSLCCMRHVGNLISAGSGLPTTTYDTLFQTEYRIRSVQWSKSQVGMIYCAWRKNRKVQTWVIQGDRKHLLFDRSSEDAYTSPGSVLVERDANGMLFIGGEEKYNCFDVIGVGASAAGNRPFVDKWTLGSKFELSKKRLWRCTYTPEDASKVTEDALPREDQKPVYEYPESIQGDWLLIRRESKEEPPNYSWYNLATRENVLLTNHTHCQPCLIGIQKEVVTYKRADGVSLTADLYLPPGYSAQRDGPLPCLLWAYPVEYKSAKGANQLKTSPHRFVQTNWSRPILFVLKGWCVLDKFSTPIIGEGTEEPNDTFIEQMQSNAKAAVTMLITRGVGIEGGFAVGGHSYGAFMTSHLLAHTNYFSAGIARSGAYNRTLTPFGFQAEERTYWETPTTYGRLSPFSHVPKIAKSSGKLLLIHGEDDENSGTFPMQSDRMFEALKGHGAISKFVLLPKEGHGYRALESILHVLAEQEEWLDKHVLPLRVKNNDENISFSTRVKILGLLLLITVGFKSRI